jgi:UDPglucose 6-dehydrogenase
MNIGWIGLGKLGLPCALAIRERGHKVLGYDVSKQVARIIRNKKIPYKEEGAQEALEKREIWFTSLEKIVEYCDIVFVAIQTPHDEKYEGVTRLPKDTKDFDYSFLQRGVSDLAEVIQKQKKSTIVVIVSTVLPGTLRREVIPLLNPYIKLCYNPSFIAMGTTMRDFLNPEFVLLGVDDRDAEEEVKKFYSTIHDRPVISMSIESAELTKVAYNTFITMKIVFSNTLMEICHKIPRANVDDVTEALKMATDRVISTKYLSAGMGDGGGCHPRDNIALSWLAERLDLSYDLFGSMMYARDKQTEWLTQLIEERITNNHPIVILGKAFKPETNIVTGSPSILLANILAERIKREPTMLSPEDLEVNEINKPCIFFIGTKHKEWLDFNFPEGSVVLDPWGYIPNIPGVEVVRVGR